MRVNTDPAAPAKKPCLRDMHVLVTTLLKPEMVQLAPLDQLQRRANEINITHPQFQEETPLVVAYEMKRRRALSGELQVVVNQSKVA